jgi:uncharacterized protein YbjT (DUF2867 family)
MRIAVIGGTGLAGRHTVDALRRAGHDSIVVARSHGVDASTGEGLSDALTGVDAVIDATNTDAGDPDTSRRKFGAITRTLLAAELRAHVQHHVLLSIVGIDRFEGNAHRAGKLVQEDLVTSGPIPFTIQRATQFHEFAESVVRSTWNGATAVIPPLLVQPVAASDVGAVLAELAVGAPLGRAPDLAGPATEDLVDMARRTMAVRSEPIRIVASWRNGVYGVEAAGEALLPGPAPRIAPTSFDTWLGAQAVGRRDDHAAVAAVRDAWVAAVARRDPSALRNFLTEDYEVWAHGAPPIVGPDAAVAAMGGALARYAIEQAFESIETVVSGDWAFERGVERMRVTPLAGGLPQEMTQRALLILRRGADGHWRYARGMTNGLPAATPDGGAPREAAPAAGRT